MSNSENRKSRTVAILLAVLIVTSTLSLVFAFIQKQEADGQRSLATEQKLETEKQRELAEQQRVVAEYHRRQAERVLEDCRNSKH